MAGNSETSGDLKAHTESYLRFLGWLKFGAAGTALVTILVVFLLTR